MTSPRYDHPMAAEYIEWAIPDCCERWRAEGKSAQEIADKVLALVNAPVDTDFYDDFGRFIDDARANFMDG